jgi:hypothetical protein
MNTTKAVTTKTKQENRRIKDTKSDIRNENTDTNKPNKNNKIIETIQSLRIRGGDVTDEDLYYDSGEEEEEEQEQEEEQEEQEQEEEEEEKEHEQEQEQEQEEEKETENEQENEHETTIGTKCNKTKETEYEITIPTRKGEGNTTTNKEERTNVKKKQMKVTRTNLPFGNICDDIAIDNDTPYIRVYCQNVCGIFDRDGIGLDSAFKEIKQAGADIFMFNETHGDESNALARRVTRTSKQRMWKDNNEDCKIIHSSSTAPVLNFTKPGGNMVGITGSLVGRIRDTITDPYGRWCGYTIIGKDNKEIMVLTAYNVSQYKNAKVGEDTLFNQQIALYKLNNIREPDPKKIFIEDLTKLVKKARMEDKDIILTGDFNEMVGDDPNGMVKVLSAGGVEL